MRQGCRLSNWQVHERAVLVADVRSFLGNDCDKTETAQMTGAERTENEGKSKHPMTKCWLAVPGWSHIDSLLRKGNYVEHTCDHRWLTRVPAVACDTYTELSLAFSGMADQINWVHFKTRTPFLANVNSCLCSLYVVVRPSVVCLSSVCRL